MTTPSPASHVLVPRETLREALRPFADYGDWIDSGETEGWDDGDVLTVSSGTVTCGEFNVGDFRRARKALGEQP